MAGNLKSMRHMLLAEVHRLTVTRADIDGPNGITLDRALGEAAGFVEFEKIEVTNASNGARFSAALAFGEPGSGTVAVDGAAAHLARLSDIITLSSYGWLKEKRAPKHQPVRVSVDSDNAVLPAFAVPKLKKNPV